MFVTALADLLFPKRCLGCGRFGDYFCKGCQRKIKKVSFQICPICERAAISGATHPKCRSSLSLDGLIAPYVYNSPLKEVIAAFKYKYIEQLSTLLTDLLLSSEQFKTFSFADFILVPIPLHKWRENKRGFNQAEKMAAFISKKKKLRGENFLSKVKNTPPQVQLKGKARKKNILGAFSVLDRKKVVGRSVLLVDDVWTTGSTIKVACAALKRAGAIQVWAAVLAR